jgi:hypothetical protein
VSNRLTGDVLDGDGGWRATAGSYLRQEMLSTNFQLLDGRLNIVDNESWTRVEVLRVALNLKHQPEGAL